MKVLLIGAGPMAQAYAKVLQALNVSFVVVGRGEGSATIFLEKTGIRPVTGGVERFIETSKEKFDHAIVATGVEALYSNTLSILECGIKSVLVEKPAGINLMEIKHLVEQSLENKANVYVAYNRRFYSSVIEAQRIIEKDGGITSFNFEFTEWGHVIEPLKKAPGVKENWFLANSSHVMDLAFYIGGKPKILKAFSEGSLSWHPKAIFSGAGITEKNGLFSYQANWAAPGRWGIELLTNSSRLILKPMEELQIQKIGSVVIDKIEFDNSLDKEFKPGVFLQVKAFIGIENKFREKLLTIEDHGLNVNNIFNKILNGW